LDVRAMLRHPALDDRLAARVARRIRARTAR
jgi:hypothetical protein